MFKHYDEDDLFWFIVVTLAVLGFVGFLATFTAALMINSATPILIFLGICILVVLLFVVKAFMELKLREQEE